MAVNAGGSASNQNAWTEEEDEVLIRMKHEGKSASMIGAKVGRSRNSVIGRVERLRSRGIDVGPKTARPDAGSSVNAWKAKPKAAAPRSRAPMAVPALTDGPSKSRREPTPEAMVLEPATPEQIARARPLWRLEDRDCRYIVAGEKIEALYCGEPAQDGSRYCSIHHRGCYHTVTVTHRRSAKDLLRLAALR